MTKSRIYLDHNASAPLLPEARAAMLDVLDHPGNASSVHAEGRYWRQELAKARQAVADLCHAKPDNCVLTSGATEGAMTVLTADWLFGRAGFRFDHLLIGATEHPCVLGGGRFPKERITIQPVDRYGLIDAERLQAELARLAERGQKPLVAIQLANSETGVLQPIADLAAIVHAHGGTLICDAVQAAGRVPLDLDELQADVLILSAHKIGGPKGAGALVFASDLMRPTPLMTGGGQERGLRSGTENVPALAGFGAAARVALTGLENRNSVKVLRDRFESGLKALDSTVEIHGDGAPRLDNTSYFTIAGRKAETLQIAFDLAGIAVSPGSACSSGKVGKSPVLEAMGKAADDGAIRVSFGPEHHADDVQRALDVLKPRSGR